MIKVKLELDIEGIKYVEEIGVEEHDIALYNTLNHKNLMLESLPMMARRLRVRASSDTTLNEKVSYITDAHSERINETFSINEGDEEETKKIIKRAYLMVPEDQRTPTTISTVAKRIGGDIPDTEIITVMNSMLISGELL